MAAFARLYSLGVTVPRLFIPESLDAASRM
jgi:hypothetical protein